MKFNRDWLPIVSLLVIAISGSLAALSVKDNKGSVVVANKNNQDNIKVNHNIDEWVDIDKPNPLAGWKCKYPLPTRANHGNHGNHGTQKSHKPSHLTKPDDVPKKPRCTHRGKCHNRPGAGKVRKVKKFGKHKNSENESNFDYSTLRPEQDKKLSPISIKNNTGTILVAGKNKKGNTKITRSFRHEHQ